MNMNGKFSSQQEKFYPRSVFYQILVLLLEISMVGSQPTNTFNPNNPNNNDQLQNGKFSAPVAIVIVVFVVALFFMGFFSIYLRQCTATTNNNNTTVRNALAIARRANTNALQAAAAAAAAEEAARGLESSVIETFPMFSYAEVKDHKIGKGALECAVCLNEFGDDETLRLIPKCDHVFHPECIDAWLEGHVTCPVCRSDLTPQAGDEPYHPPAEFNQDNPENNIASGRSDDVAFHVDLQEEVIKPDVNRIWSFKYLNRPPRTDSVRREGRNIVGLQGKFRSHSTGHSLVQPGENLDRFTLILPHEIRKEMMTRALLNRTKSVAAAVLPRNGSSTRRWYSTRFGNRSSKGGTGSGNSFQRIEQPDRWLTAPFFSRAISGKPTKVVAEKGEPSTTTILKLPSLACLEPKTSDEMSLMHVEPVQPPS